MSDQHLIQEQFRSFDSEKDGKSWYLRGVFASTRPNANGRRYPREVLEGAVAKYVDEHVHNGTSFGCLDHPDNAQVNLASAAVLITALEWVGDEVHGECVVLDTKQGQELQRILEAGGSVGMSTRGTGGVDSKGNVSSDYKLIGIDVVARASAHSARRVEAIYEHEIEEAAPYNSVTSMGNSLGERLRRIKLRNGSGVNANPRLKDKDGENHSPSARTHNPSRRGQQGMRNEAQMRLAKGDRYIDPKDTTKGSAQGNPYKPKNRPKFLKPSKSKVHLKSELIGSLLQAITDNLEEGEIFDAAMALGEHLLECNTSMPKTKPLKAKPVSSTPTRTQNNLRREAVEAHVWRAVNGGAHKQEGKQ